ncbi:MAG: bifunctional GTP diphosphokinase/guanosine-3',5'-bis(diphosphate) 3'-diphosphatase [Gammaproteobacteria bacterium RIFCSPLOWO2_02_FULL_47_50]|jgi:RelA/SpoT family (p)ppGpp synthetase|nr:MAG: bifunctional GTP diphosphokinase/guanosine-3',5'-bis(diphosphate) 3'-diphosphatase [Gammaproteobacteria bacterium RIFCSPLOWO2_01_FULL_47_190]OGT71726.1 MAG: bifunctional GTP diphosphokinase/guanosine-3',5'-bis(diphosphate) 3'-diphosphatase [Gammaproteobacteria bacterium RIFCSPLOWO2_12_47_11]OGT78273.1 MAG: bifunctional GTP diphosphokinase/guanosine-3',5'-bis(diphosphate) 3'-diphosphatase [Gammaproteobacteria bacterium RIFCSPLOWO2_02_FULL_47_50]OGT82792.1 MAG: bifunctional GTP diphosphoki
MQQLNELVRKVSTYLAPDQVEKIEQAYSFGARAHDGQHRVSGEPYIYHPLKVAQILADMHMDHQTLIAALLHDVIEDTPTVKQELSRQFGKSVAELVDGVSKLTQINFDSFEEAQAQNFRKMLMAMSNDIRVILVKLADRLHNMRTLGALRPDKRRRIARETLEIYVPIAQRLGLNNIRLELEELGFSALYPMRHRILTEQVRKARGHRKEIINKIRNALRRRLRQEKIPAQIIGREKHLYGIYQKMKNNGLSFNEVYDVYAFRIIVDSVNTCYRVVGTVHNLYKPVPGKFKDYIAIPKANGYQSLHTILFGPYGVPIEVQIRAQEMNDVAESGIAAHWLYKTGNTGERSSAHKRAREWLHSIMELQQTAGNSQEFLENVKVDLFPDAVYAFTPKGKIIELPRGATAVDFAYAIHSNVGNSCSGVRINRRLAPLSTQLFSGQTVEIIKSPGAQPNPAWLNFVVTAKARSSIRHYLKNLQQSEAITLGKRLLNRQLEILNVQYDQLTAGQIQTVLKEYKLENENALFLEIGLGNRIAPLIARKLTATGKKIDDAAKINNGHSKPFVIKGTEGMVVNFPKCCYPIPGDPIIGFASAERGIVIHNQSCKNIAEFKNQPDKWFNVEWDQHIGREFPAHIRMNATNQRGVLATVASAISDQEANIINVDIKDKDDRYTTLEFIIEVRDRQHLAHVMRRIRNIKHVSQISR